MDGPQAGRRGPDGMTGPAALAAIYGDVEFKDVSEKTKLGEFEREQEAHLEDLDKKIAKPTPTKKVSVTI